jgi:hypothetical protein
MKQQEFFTRKLLSGIPTGCFSPKSRRRESRQDVFHPKVAVGNPDRSFFTRKSPSGIPTGVFSPESRRRESRQDVFHPKVAVGNPDRSFLPEPILIFNKYQQLNFKSNENYQNRFFAPARRSTLPTF